MRTIRLLVVEDSPAYVYLIRSAFQPPRGDFSWDLTFAMDGEEAIHILFEEEKKEQPLPDLILLDWNLPKVTGSEVLQRIKKHEKLLQIPVLIFSSSDAPEDIHDAYRSHANGYIIKPGSVKLMEEIAETIGRFWVAIAQLPKVAR